MSKLLQSIGLKEKKPVITTTVAELASKNLKSGYFSKRGPTRSSKYNSRYWVLTESYLYYFPSGAANDSALGMIDLKTCKLNVEGCSPCEWVILSATPDKTREYFCKTETPELRTMWGGVIQSCINRLIEGRATFHGTPTFSPISPRSSAPESTNSASSSSSTPGHNTFSSSPFGTPSPGPSASPSASPFGGPSTAPSTADAPTSTSSNPSIFGAPGPVSKFNPLGGQEIIRVFLPDNSSKTILFDTTQSFGALAQMVSKKLGPGYDLYTIFAFTNGAISVPPASMSILSIASQWPTKNDPEHYRFVFQPQEEAERQRASTVGFLTVQTNANSHSNLPKSSSFVSQVMQTVMKKKPEWIGNIAVSALPQPILHRGTLSKKSSQLGKVKDVLAIVTEKALYYFSSEAPGPSDKSKGWVPLEKSALFQERGPTSFVVYYIYPGTLDLQRTFEVSCKSEEEKAEWIKALSPLCKGAIPVKTVNKQRRPAAASAAPRARAPPPADVATMLKTTPNDAPKLTHPTAGRPKGAGKRPPTRPNSAVPAGHSSLFGPGLGDISSTPASTALFTSAPISGDASSGLFSNPTPTSESPRMGTAQTQHSNIGVPTHAASSPILNTHQAHVAGSTSSPRPLTSSGPLSSSPSSSPNLYSVPSHLMPQTAPQQPTGSYPQFGAFQAPDSPHSGSALGSPHNGSPPGPLLNGGSQFTVPAPFSLSSSGSFPGTPPGPLVPLSLSNAAPIFNPPSGTIVSPRSGSITAPLSPRSGSIAIPLSAATPPAFGSSTPLLPISTPLLPTSSLPTTSPMSIGTPPAARPVTTASPSPASSGPILIGPNPGLFHSSAGSTNRPVVAGSPGYSFGSLYHSSSLSNPALMNPGTSASPVDPAMENDVVDLKSVLGLGSPALPKQTFPSYQSPHVTNPALAKSSNLIYSPVLSKPMPLQSGVPVAAQFPSTPFLASPNTTVSIPPSPSQTNSTTTMHMVEAPTPAILMQTSPMEVTSSPFDDLPFS